jgi:hypothetical protein
MHYFKPEHAVAAMEETRASRNLYNFSYQKRAHLIFQRITIHNQQNSPLPRLPGELRTKIYHYALGGFTIHPRCALDDTYD